MLSDDLITLPTNYCVSWKTGLKLWSNQTSIHVLDSSLDARGDAR